MRVLPLRRFGSPARRWSDALCPGRSWRTLWFPAFAGMTAGAAMTTRIVARASPRASQLRTVSRKRREAVAVTTSAA